MGIRDHFGFSANWVLDEIVRHHVEVTELEVTRMQPKLQTETVTDPRTGQPKQHSYWAHVPVTKTFRLDTSTHAVLVLRHNLSATPTFTTTLKDLSVAGGPVGAAAAAAPGVPAQRVTDVTTPPLPGAPAAETSVTVPPLPYPSILSQHMRRVSAASVAAAAAAPAAEPTDAPHAQAHAHAQASYRADPHVFPFADAVVVDVIISVDKDGIMTLTKVTLPFLPLVHAHPQFDFPLPGRKAASAAAAAPRAVTAPTADQVTAPPLPPLPEDASQVSSPPLEAPTSMTINGTAQAQARAVSSGSSHVVDSVMFCSVCCRSRRFHGPRAGAARNYAGHTHAARLVAQPVEL